MVFFMYKHIFLIKIVFFLYNKNIHTKDAINGRAAKNTTSAKRFLIRPIRYIL